MPVVCINRPNRSSKRVYTERDVGRIVAYARNDGASDGLLIAYIMQGFGQNALICLLFRVVDLLNTSIFLTGLLAILSGLLTLVKAFKVFVVGKGSFLTTKFLGFLLRVLPPQFTVPINLMLVYIGLAELLIGAFITFVTSIANNVALHLLLSDACNADLAPLRVSVDPLDLGDLPQVISDMIDVIPSNIEDI